MEVLEHRHKEEPFNISHFKEEPWQFIVELKTVKVKQKCYRGFSLWQRFYMFQIWADILKNVWFQEWVEFTDQLQDAQVIPIVSSTKYFTWASESQSPFC